MARVKRVAKARKDQGRCGRCHRPLPAGSAYLWWKFRYGGRRVRCTMPECRPRPWDLTQSVVKGQVMQLQHGFHASVSEYDPDGDQTPYEWAQDALSAVEDILGEARQIADDCQEALDQWEYGNEMLQERVDAAERWVDELEELESDLGNIVDDSTDEDAEGICFDAVDDCELL